MLLFFDIKWMWIFKVCNREYFYKNCDVFVFILWMECLRNVFDVLKIVIM